MDFGGQVRGVCDVFHSLMRSVRVSLCTAQMALQVVYQRTHPMYFSGRAVYVVAFSLRSNGSREQLYAHLMNVTARCPDACILVVGTHADQVSAMPASLSSWKREFPQVRAVIL